MRKFMAILVAGILMATAFAAPAEAKQRKRGAVDLVNDTFVIGDSLTYFGAAELQARRPNWTIDGQRGRLIDRLNPMLTDYINTYGQPRQVVIALGTNEGDDFFTKSVYENALDKLLDNTRVVFVTLYRDPKYFGQLRADRMQTASTWMNELANSRPNTTVASWRAKCLTEDEQGTPIVHDGVHQTDPRGIRIWAEKIDLAMASLMP